MSLPKPYYQDDACTIYHADCQEVLPYLDDVNLVLTSPPYNLGEGMEDKGGLRVGHTGSKWSKDALRHGYGTHEDCMPYSEYVEWQRAILRYCWATLSGDGAIYYNHKPRVVKGALRTPLELTDLPLRQIVVWDRGSGFNYMPGAYMPMHEWLMILAKPAFKLRNRAASGVGDVWHIRPAIASAHPAPFPLLLAERAIETTSSSLVLDPFMGSGTTLLAAKNTGRKAIGIEMEEKYCELAAKRLAQEVLPLEMS